MADTWRVHGGDPNRSTNWDDPPTTILHPPPKSSKKNVDLAVLCALLGWLVYVTRSKVRWPPTFGDQVGSRLESPGIHLLVEILDLLDFLKLCDDGDEKSPTS